jgi:hypothetical protein
MFRFWFRQIQIRNQIKTILSTAFHKEKCVQNLGFSFLIFLLFLLVFHLMLHPDLNPVQEPDPKCIPVPVPLRLKVAVLAASVLQLCQKIGKKIRHPF